MRAGSLAKLEREAAAFNARYPVGTPVEFWWGERGDHSLERGVIAGEPVRIAATGGARRLRESDCGLVSARPYCATWC